MICPAALDELAYNYRWRNWNSDAQITLRVLKEYGMAEDVDELVEHIGYIVRMWQGTLSDIKKIQKEESE
tara:strand:- start:443 stop:652 length:210 start_codon:yes stop_codon:yes gene_type:complete